METADVIVVGAGPGGAAAAYTLARAGKRVIVAEKGVFPREKVCGDGLTPRAVKSLHALGIDTSESNGFIKNYGLRIIGGGHRIELCWPELGEFGPYGLVRPRLDFDHLVMQRAVWAGAELREGVSVVGPWLEHGEQTGVEVRTAAGTEYWRAPLVIAADGASSRFAIKAGVQRLPTRPMGVAVRAYFESPRHEDPMLESWLELRAPSGELLPGYGWVFGVGDGTCNVGLGILNTTQAWQDTNYRQLLAAWCEGMDASWQFEPAHQRGRVQGGALPMAFTRAPAYRGGTLLVGDALGAVNPFNGEGIAYAMETGILAAQHALAALARSAPRSREQVLGEYPRALEAQYGGYFALGEVFVRLIGNPHVMALGTKYGLPRPALMRFTMKLLANLREPRGGDASDRVIAALTRLAPHRVGA